MTPRRSLRSIASKKIILGNILQPFGSKKKSTTGHGIMMRSIPEDRKIYPASNFSYSIFLNP